MCSAVYMDHNASTPIDSNVIDGMNKVMHFDWANPSSTEHSAGARAASAVEGSRDQIAKIIGARPQEIIFCSGATEANNLALVGSFSSLKDQNKTHIVSSVLEHPSILKCLDYLEGHGAKVTLVTVGKEGRVNVDDVKSALNDRTGMVSIMAANNETGVCQPINEIGSLCSERGILFHTDYSQATAYRPLNVFDSNIHMASFSGHKMYGPKGIGVLYCRLRKPRVRLRPCLHGGGQERGIRAGTLNTPAIVGLGIAFRTVEDQGSSDVDRLKELRTLLIDGLTRIPRVKINGDQSDVLVNTLSLSIQGVDPYALMRLLRDEVIFSASSACSTYTVETSHVLASMYGDVSRAKQGFRLGMGRYSTQDDVMRVISAISIGVSRLRSNVLSY